MNVSVKPSSRAGWWAFGLGTLAFVWGLVAPSVPMMLRRLSEQAGGFERPIPVPVGITILALAVLLALSAIVVGIRALRAGERSVLFFLGFIPAVLSGTFWVIFAIGEVLVPH